MITVHEESSHFCGVVVAVAKQFTPTVSDASGRIVEEGHPMATFKEAIEWVRTVLQREESALVEYMEGQYYGD